MSFEQFLIDESNPLFKRMNVEHRGIYRNLVLWLAGELLPFMPMNARYYTDHGIGHSQGILIALEELLQGVLDEMTSLEALVLLSSVWLHDIGMLISVDENGLELPEKQIREHHPEASARWIERFHKQWGLRDERIALAIALVCKYHSRKTGSIEDLPERFPIRGEAQLIRLRFLAGLLRLADALDCRWNRAPQSIPTYFVRLPVESRLHWRLYGLIVRSSIDTNSGEIGFYAEYEDDRDKVLILWKMHDIHEELQSVQKALETCGILLEKVTYTLEHNRSDAVYDVELPRDAAEIPDEFTFRKALLAELEWNREQVLISHPTPDAVQTQCPPSLVAADISVLAACECVPIESPLEKWASLSSTSDKDLAAQYYREAESHLTQLPTAERDRYFYSALVAFCSIAAQSLEGKLLSALELAFLADMLQIQRAFDFLERSSAAAAFRRIETLLRAVRTDFRTRLFRDMRRLADFNIAKQGYAHNGCCLCTARALSSLVLWQERDTAPLVLSWLKACEPHEWRAIDLVEGHIPRRMSYTYTAATLAAALDACTQTTFSGRVADLLITSHEKWGGDLEGGLLETKALILYHLYRYLRSSQLHMDGNGLEMLRLELVQFLEGLEKCQNKYEHMESITGTLFWREAEVLSQTVQEWSGLAGRLEAWAHDIREALSEDRVWGTEDGSWGYNVSRTVLLSHGWIAYWDYVWAGQRSAGFEQCSG